MDKYYEDYDKQIFEMMSNPTWWIDKQKKRKLELIRAARRIHSSSSTPTKIGGLLIWQQVIEQFLKEIVLISIGYIKGEIWPTKLDLKVDFDKKTFGPIINDYENLSIDYKGKQKIVNKLKLINKNRNEIVHRIFEVEEIKDLEILFEENYNTYEEILPLLLDHYIEICHYLEDLKSRVDWEGMLHDLRKR